VFKEIIKDHDETIEVLLALNQYSKLSSGHEETNHIHNLNINNSNNLNIILDKICQHDSMLPRGIIDLAGLFLNKKNNNIAAQIQSYFKFINKFNDMDIVFIDEQNNVLEIKPTTQIIKPFASEDLNNKFYYYDQAHIVGTDIKQPQSGHGAIIINKQTKISDMAQAMFRFRKLNRGTYLSIFIVDNNNEQIIMTPDDLYKMVLENEKKHQDNQILGLEYQLLKAMVRKLNDDYLETDLTPIYIRNIIDFNTLILIVKVRVSLLSVVLFFLSLNLLIFLSNFFSNSFCKKNNLFLNLVILLCIFSILVFV
jgi:hypothetical protein